MQVPPGQSLVSRPEEKSEGKPGNGSPKPDMIESAGPVLNLRKYYYCGHWINFTEREKGTPTYLNDGRQQSIVRYDKCNGHHRGRRPGHVFKGVARELERAHSFLV